MGENSKIAWTHHTFNPWWGCEKPLVQIGGKQVVSPECVSCYAETWDSRCGGAHWGHTALRRFFGDKHWNEPLKWNRDARKAGERRRVFCLSMGDICEDRRDLDAQRERLWPLIEQTELLDWMLLTKRADLLQVLIPPRVWRLPNVWPGVTAGTQAMANLRVPFLVRLKQCYPHLISWISSEPMLEWIDWIEAGAGVLSVGRPDLIIFGGENGGRRRCCDLKWIRCGVKQCRMTGLRPFVKQLGSNPIEGAHSIELRDRAGADPSEWPEDLRIREIPGVRA
jgi:protein gp37